MFATQLHVRETTDPNGSTIFATWCPVRVVSDAQTALRGRIRLRSRRVFPDLSDLRLDVHVETREGPSERVRLDALALGPGMEQTIELPNAVLGRLRRPDALALSVPSRPPRNRRGRRSAPRSACTKCTWLGRCVPAGAAVPRR